MLYSRCQTLKECGRFHFKVFHHYLNHLLQVAAQTVTRTRYVSVNLFFLNLLKQNPLVTKTFLIRFFFALHGHYMPVYYWTIIPDVRHKINRHPRQKISACGAFYYYEWIEIDMQSSTSGSHHNHCWHPILEQVKVRSGSGAARSPRTK
jgi:hypothetical protein